MSLIKRALSRFLFQRSRGGRPGIIGLGSGFTIAWRADSGIDELTVEIELIPGSLGDDERPRMDPETRVRLKRQFQPEVEALDALLGTSLAERWGYTS